MRKLVMLAAIVVSAFGLCLPVAAHASSHAKPAGISIGKNLVLDTSGPHKTGKIMVNGKLKVYTAYLIRRYDGGNDATWCIDNTGNGQNNGTKEQLWRCNFNNQQYWYYIPSSYGGSMAGWFQIENYGNDKCLDDTNGGGDGTQLQTWTCLQNKNQAWAGVPFNTHGGNTPSALESAVVVGNSEMSVDNANNRLADGNKIQAWAILFDGSQSWCGDPAWSTC